MATAVTAPQQKRTPEEFGNDRRVKWCPGCGDFSVLNQVKNVLAKNGADPDKTVFVSGIGCASRFPYYMGTYGLHGIHGRAPAIASGLRLARPDLDIWVVTGDGDGLAIGGNHLLHAIRRNINLKILLFNNRIYGLTKGQVSPTSEQHSLTVSTPRGSLGAQISPCAFAVGCEATFVARTVDSLPQHLEYTLSRAAAHRGVSFVEIYQHCVTFNKGAFEYATDRQVRSDNLVELGHGKALLFGEELDKGIRLASGYRPEVVKLGENNMTVGDVLIHDEKAPTPALAFLLARLRRPDYPEPIGIFRDIAAPSYDQMLNDRVEEERTDPAEFDLQSVLDGPDTWTVGGNGEASAAGA